MTFNYSFFSTHIVPFIIAIGFILVGIFIARIVSIGFTKTFIRRLTPQQTMLIRRVIFYFILALFVATAFEQLGFQISTLLGAAGILTVAIGIASQTSMSNIVSGLFMIGEKPFEIGDFIKVGELSGEILSIDLLAVRIRTQDNTLLRIPNEMLIKSSLVNLSYFPIRRLDLKLSVPYSEDLNKVKELLLTIANKNPLSFIDPKPQMQILGFGDGKVDLQFSVWTAKNHFQELKNALQLEIKDAFVANQIIFPGTSPLSVKILGSEKTH